MNGILAALHGRKSVRAFLDEPISDDDKNAILLAARAATTVERPGIGACCCGSDLSREMTRSVEKYLAQFDTAGKQD